MKDRSTLYITSLLFLFLIGYVAYRFKISPPAQRTKETKSTAPSRGEKKEGTEIKPAAKASVIPKKSPISVKKSMPRELTGAPKVSPPTTAPVRGGAPSTPSTRPASTGEDLQFYRQFMELRYRVLSPKGGLIYKEKLLTPSDVQRLLKLPFPLSDWFLQGIPRSNNYDALQYLPEGRELGATEYVVAFQIWKNSPPAIKRTWAEQLQTYPSVKKIRAIKGAKESFTAKRKPFVYLNFLSADGKAIGSLSCSMKYCSDFKKLIPLGEFILKRMAKSER